MEEHQLLIGGEWIESERRTEVVNPATEQAFATVASASAEQVDKAVAAAAKAWPEWAKLPAVERGACLRRWADLVDRDSDALARLVTQEVGKPLAEAHGEIQFGNSWFRYYAEFDRRIEGEILPADRPNEQLFIFPQPLGVVSAIIPWNYPSAVAIRKIAPALIAGNTIVLKPHEHTPLSAIALGRLAMEAGVPPGVVNIVTGPGETTGEALVANSTPQLITFTGSVATGKRIAKMAADNVTVVSLELGGKAPFIVMDDCNLDAAVDGAVFARFLNCGQVCICNERTYVHEKVAEEFTEKFVAKVRELKVGDPLREATKIGPKVSRSELEKVDQYVQEAVSQGARAATGGRRLTEGEFARGYWYEPTVLTGVSQQMPVMQKEIFGPVAPLMTCSGFEEAIALANDSPFGLAGYLYTKDIDRLMRAVRDIEVGELYINRGPGESIHGFHTGWKQSGIGGDDGKHGLDHYLRRKTVYLRYDA
ncbi:aldehyde dehydrogenase [Botrimarina sp.]|uniref:aldehyde dehydrogenase n=1 Tax=Botrimarina sp. TaxID=2795802 RepID=UPI0032F07B00